MSGAELERLTASLATVQAELKTAQEQAQEVRDKTFVLQGKIAAIERLAVSWSQEGVSPDFIISVTLRAASDQIIAILKSEETGIHRPNEEVAP